MLKSQDIKVKSGATGGCSGVCHGRSDAQETCSSSRKTCSRKKSCFATSRVCSVSAGACFSALSILSLIALNPACGSANALTTEELESGSLTSSVSISFAPASGNTTLSPTSASGASGLISVLANVGVSNSGGYSVYLGSSSPNLVGRKDSSVVIPGVSGEVSFSDLQDNTWGYYAGEGSSIPEDATYKAISQGQGDTILVNNNSRVKNENKTFILGFAAKISNDVPADTYENQVTLSVLSSPYQLTLMDIDNMQDMTSAICENSPQLSTKQLKDVRDGKYYWVTKLADDNCWMTQDLALDLYTSQELTSEDTDVSRNWHPGSDTSSELKAFNGDVMLAETHSWKQGLVVINPIAINTSCGNSAEGQGLQTEGCQKVGFTNVEGFTQSSDPNFASSNGSPIDVKNKIYDAHYLIGNYYQWNTAVAGTGFDANGEPLKSAGTASQASSEASLVDATSSICPKGWRLPTSGRLDEDNYTNALSREYSFKALLQHYETNTNEISFEAMLGKPLFLHLGGALVRNGYIAYPNQLGKYASSTVEPDPDYAYELGFWANWTIDENIFPSGNSIKTDGSLVRCVAR